MSSFLTLGLIQSVKPSVLPLQSVLLLNEARNAELLMWLRSDSEDGDIFELITQRDSQDVIEKLCENIEIYISGMDSTAHLCY